MALAKRRMVNRNMEESEKTLKLPIVFEILQEIEERAQAAAAREIMEIGE